MSYKTQRLVELFPDAYAAREPGSALHRLLDAIGSELMSADATVKALMKSHWVDYASDQALDGLGSLFGLERRTLSSGEPESDDALRQRLKSVVRLFTGGGTRLAVLGAVRSALGLPFDLSQLKLPPGYEDLRAAIDELITLDEFSPKLESIRENRVTTAGDAAELVLAVDLPAVKQGTPRIEWTFVSGAARLISLQRKDSALGFRTGPGAFFAEGDKLVFTSDAAGRLSAIVDQQDVSAQFTNLDGSTPAVLPEIPLGRSEWVFHAQSGFDNGTFDADTFDLPSMSVELQWVLYQPLTFDLNVPYALKEAVRQLALRYQYDGELFVYEGLPLERLPEVVDQTRAAGVRGSVHFSLQVFEDQGLREGPLLQLGTRATLEDAGLADALSVGSVNDSDESHDLRDGLGVGGVFDVSWFDGTWVFDG